jgi:hypothetical protein
MRHAHGPNLWDTLEDNVPDYRALYVQRGDIPTRGVLRYITQVTEPAPTQSLRAQIRRQINPQLEDELMSWADRLLAEGRQEERAHSKVVLARSVENLVKLRFGPPSDWALSKIRAAELSTLERWSDEILTTTSLEALLSDESPSASSSRDVT